MTAYYRYDCGCRWPIVGPPPRDGALPLMAVDDENLPFCTATWKILCRGDTKGVFQLESNLGRQWTKKLGPTSGEHMGALGALLRPGCLHAVDDEGVSMTERFVLVKNGQEKARLFHPSVDWILKPTYGCLVFQEQAMEIAKAVSGFSLMEADTLRKAIGKKPPEEMAKVKKMFLDGARVAGIVTTEQAETLFGWIEASQRYSFNKSHAISYGLEGYDTAYAKAHGPVAFYMAWLGFAWEKQDPLQEIYDLVMDARLNGVPILPPDLRTLEGHFHTDGVEVRFGLSDIKGVGEKQVTATTEAVRALEGRLGKKVGGWSWTEVLFFLAEHVRSSFLKVVIASGGLDWTKKSRKSMDYEQEQWAKLTKPEQEWIRQREEVTRGLRPIEDILPEVPPEPAAGPKGWKAKHRTWEKKKLAHDALEAEIRSRGKFADLASAVRAVARPKGEGGGAANCKRVSFLQSLASVLAKPGSGMDDRPSELAYLEESLLGVALTASWVEEFGRADVNTSCLEFASGKKGYIVLGVTVEQVREVRTKKGENPGQKMAFLTLADETCCLTDVICFPDVWREYHYLLRQDACVIIQGERDARQGSLVVKKVKEMTE